MNAENATPSAGGLVWWLLALSVWLLAATGVLLLLRKAAKHKPLQDDARAKLSAYLAQQLVRWYEQRLSSTEVRSRIASSMSEKLKESIEQQDRAYKQALGWLGAKGPEHRDG